MTKIPFQCSCNIFFFSKRVRFETPEQDAVHDKRARLETSQQDSGFQSQSSDAPAQTSQDLSQWSSSQLDDEYLRLRQEKETFLEEHPLESQRSNQEKSVIQKIRDRMKKLSKRVGPPAPLATPGERQRTGNSPFQSVTAPRFGRNGSDDDSNTMSSTKAKEKTGRRTRTVGGEGVKAPVETREKTSPPQVQCSNKSYQKVLTLTYI